MDLIDYLNKNNTKYENTSDGLVVKESLYLRGCAGLTCLPDNLKVDGYLDLDGCTGLKSLPDNLQVERSLSLASCAGLKSLPDNLQVGENLVLDGCTLYPFDESKFMILGDYNIIPNSYRFITENDL